MRTQIGNRYSAGLAVLTFLLVGLLSPTLAAKESSRPTATSSAGSTADGEKTPEKMWTVTVSAGPGGSAKPSGVTSVKDGGTVTVRILPDPGQRTAEVKVDGVSVRPSAEFTLGKVTNDHQVSVSFVPVRGSAVRFRLNGDGTATDTSTGLMWVTDAGCLGYRTWTEALRMLPGSAGAALPGCSVPHADWRLPNAYELISLMTGGRDELLCGGEVCPTVAQRLEAQGFRNVGIAPYWSSTTVVDTPERAWVIDAGDGSLSSVGKTAAVFAWPVRSADEGQPRPWPWKTLQERCFDETGAVVACEGTGQDGDLRMGSAWPSPRLVDNGEGTVTDRLLGISWLKDAGCLPETTKEGAPGAVEPFNAAPGGFDCFEYSAQYTDWRLPSRAEFLGRMDFSQPFPQLPTGHPFVGVQGAGYWATDFEGAEAEVRHAVMVAAPATAATARSLWPVRAGPPEADAKTDPTSPPAGGRAVAPGPTSGQSAQVPAGQSASPVAETAGEEPGDRDDGGLCFLRA